MRNKLPNIENLDKSKPIFTEEITGEDEKIEEVSAEGDPLRAVRHYASWLKLHKDKIVLIDRLFYYEFGYHRVIVIYQKKEDKGGERKKKPIGF
ncbi:MAG: hypothetical protein WC459_04195 [Patescibacteria group bacterium]